MDMTTRYMGLTLKNPLVASASPLSESLDDIRRLEDNGAAAVVMFSLFEEQIRHDSAALEHFFSVGRDSFGEAASYFPEIQDYDVGPGQYLDLIRRATEAVDIPIIASLNGVSEHGWVSFAKEMEDAGASGIELNVYYIPTETFRSGAEVEQQYVNVLSSVKANVAIPVAIKVGPYFSSFADMAGQLDEAGADALVLFNRFYQPDFDIETADRGSLAHVEPTRRDSVAAAVDRAAVRSRVGLPGGDHRRAQSRRGHQVPDGGRGRRDEHGGPAAAGPAVFRASPRRDDRLDGEEGLHLRRPDARLDEPAVSHGLERVRARQLHQGPRKLHEDNDQHA